MKGKKYMYRTSIYDPAKIRKHEVTKTTDKTVWYVRVYSFGKARPRGERREGRHHKWHETFEDARAFLMHSADTKIKQTQKEIEEQRNNIGDLIESKNGS